MLKLYMSVYFLVVFSLFQFIGMLKTGFVFIPKEGPQKRLDMYSLFAAIPSFIFLNIFIFETFGIE